MKNALGAIAFLATMLIMGAAIHPAYAGNKYRLITALGDVKIITGTTSSPAVQGQDLSGDQIIVTGKGSMADVSLGGRGLMRVQENTRVAVATIEKKGGPDLDMEQGGILVILSKLLKGNSYQVKTHTQVVSVRGTIFQVSGDTSKSQLDVFTGSVMVSPVTDGAIQSQIVQMVTEGQSLSLDRRTVLEILAKRRKISLSAIRAEVKDAFMKQAMTMRELPEYKKLNRDTRKELDDRIQRIRQELKEKGLDRESLKEKLIDRKALKEKLEERKQGIIDRLKNR
ncbi:MAG: FecR domain-containing protein [Spirochaetes bacterium]|nr:FecR domain-containing protein [Spirochaetota bacterium]